MARESCAGCYIVKEYTSGWKWFGLSRGLKEENHMHEEQFVPIFLWDYVKEVTTLKLSYNDYVLSNLRERNKTLDTFE